MHRQRVSWGKGKFLQPSFRAEQQPGLPRSNTPPARRGSLGASQAVLHPYPIPSTWLCPVLWDRAGAQASCKTSPSGNPFPLQQELLHALTLLGKSNPEAIWDWVLRKTCASVQYLSWCSTHVHKTCSSGPLAAWRSLTYWGHAPNLLIKIIYKNYLYII